MERARIIREKECTPEKLPAVGIAGKVVESLRSNPFLVVTAAPGAGKSTFLPVAILNGLDTEGKVLLLEPRRIAARHIAERMAWLLGEPVGKTVGYRIRFESKVSDCTRIEVLTEGILTRMLADDPTLDGVAAVIFDEFHERSLVCDLALALTRETCRTIRPDLRVVVMSATVDSSSICERLGAPLVESEGRMFPVRTEYSKEDTSVENCALDVARAIIRSHREEDGDILAFLPGEGEIRKCADLLGDSLGATAVRPLYGMLSSDEQKKALETSDRGERKVVLATPIAETSLTIEGVRTVIDSGFFKKMVYDPKNGIGHLETVRISRDMAAQRCGRAGRTASGICHRLWTEATDRRMEECRRPEILDADLAPMVLDIASWGGGRPEDLQWMTPPPTDRTAKARKLLQSMEAIDRQGSITPHGRILASLPCHPRIANMMENASTPSDKALAADIAAILEEKDRMSLEKDGADICLRIDSLRRNRSSRQWAGTARIAAQYRRLAKVPEDDSPVSEYAAGNLIAQAFPERIARSTGCGHFLLADGQTARVETGDSLSANDYLAVAAVNSRTGGEGKILLACAVDPMQTGLIREREVVCWDSRAGKVLAQKEFRIGNILIDSKPLPNASRKEIIKAICDAAPKEGLSMFDFNDEVRNLLRRVAAASSWDPSLNIPELSPEIILSRAEEWLPVSAGKASSAAELKKIDLCNVITGLLTYDQMKAVERLAPSHIEVPTGSRIRVEYRQGADLPVLRVRLQECFGLTETPKVNGGKTPVLMELLSPGFKPVQLTSDLKSFWNDTYFEVRKELRMRYPKHSWPENPLDAEAVRGPLKRKKI